jgi:hypothetical protein
MNKPWFIQLKFAPMKTFHVKLSRYQYARLLGKLYGQGDVSHEDAEQTIREALAKLWGDNKK